jgi:hypothetical protein
MAGAYAIRPSPHVIPTNAAVPMPHTWVLAFWRYFAAMLKVPVSSLNLDILLWSACVATAIFLLLRQQ